MAETIKVPPAAAIILPAAPPVIRVAKPYLPLIAWDWPERYMILSGGRGSAKSFSLGLALALLLRSPGHRILFTRYTLVSAKDSIIPEFEQKLAILGIRNEFVTIGDNIRHIKSESEILFRGIRTSSGNQTAKLKSLYGITVWVLEEAEEMDNEKEFDKIDLSVRATTRPNKVILVLNPSHVEHWIYKRWWKPYGIQNGFCGAVSGVRYIHTNYRINVANLPSELVEQAARIAVSDPEKYRHVHLGYWTTNADGAMWKRKWITDHRIAEVNAPAMRRIVVAIDPSTTSKNTSDEAGIIVAGIGVDGRYYVLADESKRASPNQWAAAAIAAYHDNEADRVVYEANQGGDMVKSVLQNLDPSLPVTPVWASRGKQPRGEPIAALYETGKVSHVGEFPVLEGELVSWIPGNPSPNHLDALVWALSELAGTSRGGGGAAGGNRWAGVARRGVM